MPSAEMAMTEVDVTCNCRSQMLRVSYLTIESVICMYVCMYVCVMVVFTYLCFYVVYAG